MAKKTAEEVIKELRQMLDETADMIVKLMTNSNYLKQEQDKIKDELDLMQSKLNEVSKMTLILITHSDSPEVSKLVTEMMMSNKEFVNYAEKIANEETFESMLESMSKNPIFGLNDLDIKNMSDEQKDMYRQTWEQTKEMFTLAGMQHDLAEEE
tara:strand:- start:1597 stop:2058 length:462 start_codon:yes stop_codon:yes gene_type:complete